MSIFSDAALVSRAVVTYNEACSLALDMFQSIRLPVQITARWNQLSDDEVKASNL